jgi:hypothetical protein
LAQQLISDVVTENVIDHAKAIKPKNRQPDAASFLRQDAVEFPLYPRAIPEICY